MPSMIRTNKEFREIAEDILKIKDRMNDKRSKKTKKRKEKKVNDKKNNK